MVAISFILKYFTGKNPTNLSPSFETPIRTHVETHTSTHTHTQILYLNTPGTDIYLQNDKMISGPSGPMFTPIQQNHILPVMLFPDPFPFKQQR